MSDMSCACVWILIAALSELNGPLSYTPLPYSADAYCLSSRLGYNLDPDILYSIGHPFDIGTIIDHPLAIGLVLNPIAADLSFLALICMIPAATHGRTYEMFALLMTIISAIASSIGLGMAFGLIGVAKSRIGLLTFFAYVVPIGRAS
ncbi:hypothetical protein M422DRAFT_262216 [Sphaerobolus stellatus SS14]|uniref:Uncharacterized protein n=1 Tax=Sphaerobolus stellatus (strain SS14) TaxID=990650 RepID=A0A0C9TYA3_SPHS4|nr:hypothetical protein M422DRAFT_268037 [Sphaerobolus stellatus SS14]KIJ35448.1 hypothetical protein M422DRAFT_262216 [Sphaerobolus stellatus SS14]